MNIISLLNVPLAFFLICFGVFWLSGHTGAYRRRGQLDPAENEHLSFIVGAALMLLGLIIGFSFSMAVARYDQRKNYEEEEAHAIGTEYVRAGLLPAADTAKVRALLKSYLDQRVLFYTCLSPKSYPRQNGCAPRTRGEAGVATAGTVAWRRTMTLRPCISAARYVGGGATDFHRLLLPTTG